MNRRSRSPPSRSDSSSDDSLDRHRHRRSRSPSSSDSDSVAKREARRKRKEEKRSKKKEKKRLKKLEKKEKKLLAVTDRWGKYGVIRASDKFQKAAEFDAWLTEVKKSPRVSLSLSEETDLFAQFVEDYNTATFPHKKYYDLATYENKKRERKDRQKKSEPTHHLDTLADNDSPRIDNTEAIERRLLESEHRQVELLLASLHQAKNDKE